MEFLFRPIERWIEGGWRGSKKLDRKRAAFHPRRLATHAVTLVLALVLAHTFLAYFVPPAELATWMRRSPVEHPTSFFIMLFTTGLIFFDFGYFREQTCLVACPYGRLQSVLLDPRSLIVGYDTRRGEPRMKGMPRPAGSGDCVNCELCVLTCPTGIDIREGLQMECIHCTQCIDACDAVMTRIGKPRGLIRYGSRDGFDRKAGGWLRPRAVVYPAALALTFGLFGWALVSRSDSEVTVLRGIGAPFVRDEQGRVVNQVRIKITNRAGAERRYALAIDGASGFSLIAPINPLPVAAGRSVTTSVFVVGAPGAFSKGEREIQVRVSDGMRFSASLPYELMGPDEENEEDHPGREHER
jgi:cytochrome c oxidase accessory protein FixG